MGRFAGADYCRLRTILSVGIRFREEHDGIGATQLHLPEGTVQLLTPRERVHHPIIGKGREALTVTPER